MGSPLILSFLNALIRCIPGLISFVLGLIVWVVICLILGRTPRVFGRFANRSCLAPLIQRWLLHWMIRAGILRAPFIRIKWFTGWSLKFWWPWIIWFRFWNRLCPLLWFFRTERFTFNLTAPVARWWISVFLLLRHCPGLIILLYQSFVVRLVPCILFFAWR